MAYKIELGGDGTLRLVYYQNKVGGGSRVVATNHPDSHFLTGVSLQEMYLSYDDLEIVMTYLKAVRKEIDPEMFRSGN